MAKLVSFADFQRAMVFWNAAYEKKYQPLIKELAKGSILRDGQTIPFFISTLKCGKMLPYVSDGLVEHLKLTALDVEISQKLAVRLAEEETLKAKAAREKARADKEKARANSEAAKEAAKKAAAVALFDDVIKSLGSVEW